MKKKEDIIIITWKFCKQQQFYELADVRNHLKTLGFDEENIQFATSLAEESSYKLKNGKCSLKSESYINLLNYEEVQFAKRSVKIARWSIWFAIIALLASMVFQFIKIEPVKTYNFWNSKIEAKQN
jgi:hypothetical protein